MHPKQSVDALRIARRLWSDDTTIGTLAAVVLVAVFVLWPLYRLYQASPAGGDR